MVIGTTKTHIFPISSSYTSHLETHTGQVMAPQLAQICAGRGYYMRTHLLCLHGLMIFSTSLPVYKKENHEQEIHIYQ